MGQCVVGVGTRTPPPLVHLAITGFIAFAETALERARIQGVARREVMQLLSDTLVATIHAAQTASGG